MKRLALYFSTTLLMLMAVMLADGFQSIPEWVKYTSVQGRYTVLFPEQPKLSSEEQNVPAGAKHFRYSAQASDSDSLYTVRHFDLLHNMNFSLETMRGAVVRNFEGKLLGSADINIGGSPGFELKVLLKDESGIEFLLRQRVYSAGGRIYSLEHFVPQVL
jgi:hypothetical protein